MGLKIRGRRKFAAIRYITPLPTEPRSRLEFFRPTNDICYKSHAIQQNNAWHNAESVPAKHAVHRPAATTSIIINNKINLYLFIVCIVVVVVVSPPPLNTGLLATGQYSEGPATGHLDTGFSSFPCAQKQMLRWFPRFQIANTCFSYSPPDLNLVVTNFMFCIHVK